MCLWGNCGPEELLVWWMWRTTRTWAVRTRNRIPRVTGLNKFFLMNSGILSLNFFCSDILTDKYSFLQPNYTENTVFIIILLICNKVEITNFQHFEKNTLSCFVFVVKFHQSFLTVRLWFNVHGKIPSTVTNCANNVKNLQTRVKYNGALLLLALNHCMQSGIVHTYSNTHLYSDTHTTFSFWNWPVHEISYTDRTKEIFIFWTLNTFLIYRILSI